MSGGYNQTEVSQIGIQEDQRPQEAYQVEIEEDDES